MNATILRRNAVLVILGLVLILGINFYWQNLRGVGPVVKDPGKPDEKNLTAENKTGFPLILPAGFSIEIFAKELPGARVMAFDNDQLWITRTSQNKVSVLYIQDGKVVDRDDDYDVLGKLNKPHGLVFSPTEPNVLYFAEGSKISRADLSKKHGEPITKIADLPSQGGGHFTRTLEFGPDGRLYVSIGSSCNVCEESDPRRAAIYSMNKDGSDFKLFAKGLRNTVFFTWHPKTGKMWGTDMGRDLLGDDLPPEEINIIEESKDYGWPICYGNKVHDTDFDKKQYFRDPCEDTVAAHVEMPAHSAPLGLAFIPKDFGRADWEDDLIVAFHGSWNRTEPTGYKLVRVKLDDNGNFEGMEDFITGWLQGNTSYGRPVDVVFHGEDLYVSDDKAGMVYKIIYNGNK